MNILMVATEMVPLAKTGGLADVVGALSAALRANGHEVRAAIPFYASVGPGKTGATVDPVTEVEIPMPDGPVAGRVLLARGGSLPVPVYLVECARYFGRPGIYDDPATKEGYPDNAERIFFFNRALLEALPRAGFTVDVLHAHDHQAAPLVSYRRLLPAKMALLGSPATVMTIHNLGYQGIFARDTFDASGLPGSLFESMSPFEFHGMVNLMKMGICHAEQITTVSPRYAYEITTSAEYGCGLEGVLRERAGDLTGILNGIDTTVWNPAVDTLIPFRYDRASLAGKAENRSALRKRFGLPAASGPLIGAVARLTQQKGFDLLLDILPEVLKMDLQLAILGTGSEDYHRRLRAAADAHPDRFGLVLGFDDALAHLIEAGSDAFLMPSRYEPCGLNQMYSLVYGTVPVVRATGGLADTVVDIDEDDARGNGFVFRSYEPVELLRTMRRCMRYFGDRKLWSSMMANGMAADFSWGRSAAEYVSVYRRANASAR